ncbi:MAG: hypothetical protein WAW61_11235 [Methylococcaceae bacterium]
MNHKKTFLYNMFRKTFKLSTDKYRALLVTTKFPCSVITLKKFYFLSRYKLVTEFLSKNDEQSRFRALIEQINNSDTEKPKPNWIVTKAPRIVPALLLTSNHKPAFKQKEYRSRSASDNNSI